MMNRSIGKLSDTVVILHWRTPEEIITDEHYRYIGEEMLIVSLAQLATKDPCT